MRYAKEHHIIENGAFLLPQGFMPFRVKGQDERIEIYNHTPHPSPLPGGEGIILKHISIRSVRCAHVRRPVRAHSARYLFHYV